MRIQGFPPMQRKFITKYLINEHQRILKFEKHISSTTHPFYNIILAVQSARPAKVAWHF